MISISKPYIGNEEVDAVVSVLRSGMLAQGPKTKEFEKMFAEYCGTKYAIAFNSGTAAIHAGLYGLGITAGDEVITTPFTFVATANPILMQRAHAVLCDIKEDDFCIDPERVQRCITKSTKAIIAVDLYGQIFRYDELRRIADHRHVRILEDACQSVGATYHGRNAGTCGDAAAFSLYATKNISSGEGGVLTTDDHEVAELARRFRHHGQSEHTRYEYWDLGYNYRMTDIAAAIALVQMSRLDRFSEQRIANAAVLSEGLKSVRGIVVPVPREGTKHVFHQYTIRVTEEYGHTRDELAAYLKEHMIGTGIYYPKPLHLHPHFARMGYKLGDFPVSEQMSREVLSLPVHPQITGQELQTIIAAITSYAR